jgi:hypothetical protein
MIQVPSCRCCISFSVAVHTERLQHNNNTTTGNCIYTKRQILISNSTYKHSESDYQNNEYSLHTITGRSKTNTTQISRAIAQEVSRWLPTAAAGFAPGPGQVGFVVDKLTLGQVFSEYFGFPCQSLFHQILHYNHPGQVQ